MSQEGLGEPWGSSLLIATSAASQGLVTSSEGALVVVEGAANEHHSCWKQALLAEGNDVSEMELSRRPHTAWMGCALG